MPSDLVIDVRQISSYPELGGSNGTETVLLQQGGLGGPYASISTGALVSTALNGLGSIGVGTSVPPIATTGHVFTATNHVLPDDASLLWNAYWDGTNYQSWLGGTAGNIEFTQGGWDFQVAAGSAGQPITFSPVMTLNIDGSMLLPFNTLTVARDPATQNEVATMGWVGRSTVASFNQRNGAVQLNAQDVYSALKLCDPIATQPWVQQAITNSIQNLLYTCPFVNTWNNRQGSVYLMLSDITCVFYQSGQQPISPTPPVTSDDDSIATTAFVTRAISGGAGSIDMNPGSGNVVPAYPVGNSLPAAEYTPEIGIMAQLVCQTETTSQTNPEWTGVFGIWSNTGYAPATGGSQKVALYAGAVQSPGSGPVWSLNTLVTRNASQGVNNTPGGPGNIGSGTPGTPGAIPFEAITVGYELDWNNFDQDLAVGSGFGVGMWINMLGSYPATAAIYMSNVNSDSLLNYGWHDGILFSGQYLIQDNTIIDSTHSRFSYTDQGTHANASHYLADTSPVGLQISGNHTTTDIWATDNAPTVLTVIGTHTSIVDVSGATISGQGWNGQLTVNGNIIATGGFGVVGSYLEVGAGGPAWSAGAGAPTSTQPVGSLYSRTDGAVGTHLYVSAGGGTWNAVAGV